MIQTLHIAEPQQRALMRHLFPGDADEHGAVIIAGLVESARGTRFLAREVVLARDGIDYVPGTHGYRALTTDFIVRVSDRCARKNLCYFAVHCHSGRGAVSFSPDDLASHRRGYPALLDITNGGPVGALVFTENGATGNVWRRSGVTSLDRVTVVGPNLLHFFPSPPAATGSIDPVYNRQSLLFGQRGQDALGRAKVGIIGLGGVGSLMSEWLAHLGVGHIVGVDFDYLEPSNRPRVVGTTPWDAGEPFVSSRFRLLRALGKRLAKRKVDIAARVARRANRAIVFEPIAGNILDIDTARQLRDVDYLFLCADGMQPRLVFNAIVHQYLIPGFQIGSKVPVDRTRGAVESPFVVSRRVLPQSGGGCLSCNKLIPPDRLQEESLTPEERRRHGYVTDVAVTVPSVITLNALAAAQAANDFLFGFHGLLLDSAATGYHMHHPRERLWERVNVSHDETCLHCGTRPASAYARGDRWTLPCRASYSDP